MADKLKSQWTALVIILLVVLNLGMIAFMLLRNPMSNPGGPMEGRGPGGKDPIAVFFKEEIGFDREQMATFEQMRRENRSVMQQYNRELREKKDRFFNMISEGENGQAAADSLAKEIGQLHSKIDQTVFRHFSGLREICTDSQKVKFDQMISDLMRRSRPPQGPPQGKL